MIPCYYLASVGLVAALFPNAVIAQTTAASSPAISVGATPTGVPKPAYLRLGVGTAYDIGRSYRCTRLALEYAPTLTRHFGLAGRLVGVFGQPDSQIERQLSDQRYKAGFVEVEGLYYPFGTDKRVLFGLGAGGFAGYYRKDSYSVLQTTAGRVDFYERYAYKGPYAGYLLSVNVDAAVDTQQRWRVGAKATLQNGLNGGGTATYNFTLARRL